MREIVFDTETTGLDPKTGDRIVEIGGIELFNHIPTGKSFHRYVNPERSVPVEAQRVHGLDDSFLKDKPVFAAVVAEHPGSPASLDALMSRYQIDASRRTLHGALLDAELLAEVYIELIGGRQAALVLGGEPEAPTITVGHASAVIGARPTPRAFNVSAEELAAHAAAVSALGDKALWLRYMPAAVAAA